MAAVNICCQLRFDATGTNTPARAGRTPSDAESAVRAE
jgi:hypothetical protein